MLPAYIAGDHVLVDRMFFRVNGLHRGDVLIVNFLDNGDAVNLKRIIGMPGEQVRIYDGHVLINGKLLDEPYLTPGTKTSTMDKDTWQLGPQEYFVMGDNRPESADSRNHGPVHETNIIGRVLIHY